MLSSTFKYMQENQKTLSWVELDRLKFHIVKFHATPSKIPPDFGVFWDATFLIDPNPMKIFVDRFREFDVGFIRQRMNEMNSSFQESPFQTVYFTSYGIPGAMCPDCIGKGREHRILKDNILEKARCEACGVTDYIYAFRKELPDGVRAEAKKELARIFKAAEASRAGESDPLEQKIREDMEALRKDTDVVLCTESIIHTEEDVQNWPQPEVQHMLPYRERRYP
ncbi:MAG: hypothetical protein Q9195_006835 [Heterodermia aff. obscurata]